MTRCKLCTLLVVVAEVAFSKEVADWADVVFTDTVGLRLTTTDNRQH